MIYNNFEETYEIKYFSSIRLLDILMSLCQNYFSGNFRASL